MLNWSKINWKKLIKSIILCQTAGVIASLFTTSGVTRWYPSLIKPPITPPNWLFAPVWITLYTLLGVSFYLVWNHSKGEKRIAFALFGVQLVLNSLWSILFFNYHLMLFSLMEIIFLWFFALGTFIEFKELNKTAAYLLLPYLAWLTIAMILNFSITWLNY